ncbi:MAG: hypothetical protein RR329_03300 [Mucinivorans sp.]
MKNFTLTICLILLLVSCGSQSTTTATLFPENNSEKALKYTVKIDTLVINDSTTSFIGKTFIDEKNIYFADQFFNYVYKFDTQGKLTGRYLGSGKSNKELAVGNFNGAAMFTDDARTVYLGHQIDVHLYDPAFEKIKTFQIQNYLDNIDPKANPYDTPKGYTYALDNFVIRGISDAIYINIYADVSGRNPVEFPQAYYTNGHPIMKIGLGSNKVEGLLWNFPPAYSENYGDKGILFHVLFDVDKAGNFYICCEADSTIYSYDKDFNPIGACGYQGSDMDTQYAKVASYADANNVWEETRKKGLYQWLEYIDQTGLLFRTYSKSADADTWGLQVFLDNSMVAHADVPVGLKVIGYIDPYYYGEIIADPDKKTMKILRFKLDKK